MKAPVKSSKTLRRKGGNPPFVKTEAQRQLVELHSAMGTRLVDIAKIVGIPVRTLTKHFREELSLGHAKANAKVAATLYNKAISGDTTSMIFWLKTRGGWKESNTLEVSGPEGGPIKAGVVVVPAHIEDISAWIERYKPKEIESMPELDGE